MTVAVRPPAVAGSFYPGAADALRREVERLLADPAPAGATTGVSTAGAATTGDGPPPPDPRIPPRALVLPHAGYEFSGPVAAAGYRLVADAVRSGAVRRIVVVGPAHRVAVDGVADAGVGAFATPLGEVEVPADLLATLRRRLADTHPGLLVTSPAVHAREHSVEVHLPFLRVVAPGVPVLPLVAGHVEPEGMAALVAAILAEDGVLLIVSSDLSHFLSESEARRVDADTLSRVTGAGSLLPPRRACGAVPWNGLMLDAAARGLRATVLAHSTSARSPRGDPARVVGYPAVRYDPIGPTLPAYARAVLAHHLGAGRDPGLSPGWPALLGHPWLRRDGASFVTLTTAGRLRGCVGTIEPYRGLGADVAGNALAAATRDHRFEPVTPGELPDLHVEVSVLSATEPVAADGLEAATRALRPGVDGVVLSGRGRSGVFLPQMWDPLPEATDFMAALRRKAGLDHLDWDDSWSLRRFVVDKWGEDRT
ncbi:AmmeMemoRadiSam system protein B [Dietzia sp. UBA5065]|uniref:AmmeMemoRadiSam system protein B n=1 Tax=Dietzia sp. UBA5065 TaxID=1946422 RepID=UPI0025BBC527|nr:AmmeMemoRadiSam system protein B [Dietzia sp. UBA5065]